MIKTMFVICEHVPSKGKFTKGKKYIAKDSDDIWIYDDNCNWVPYIQYRACTFRSKFGRLLFDEYFKITGGGFTFNNKKELNAYIEKMNKKAVFINVAVISESFSIDKNLYSNYESIKIYNVKDIRLPSLIKELANTVDIFIVYDNNVITPIDPKDIEIIIDSISSKKPPKKPEMGPLIRVL